MISWRADGNFFATSTIDEFKPVNSDDVLFCRRLRVWNRNLDLVSKCEFLNGMEANISFRSTTRSQSYLSQQIENLGQPEI